MSSRKTILIFLAVSASSLGLITLIAVMSSDTGRRVVAVSFFLLACVAAFQQYRWRGTGAAWATFWTLYFFFGFVFFVADGLQKGH